jgi:ubiquinone biosynthesis protein
MLPRLRFCQAGLRHCCQLLDKAVRSKSAVNDAGGALCQALVRLGPGFIKFGQALSTRADLIGPELGRSLTMLQDRLPPFAAAKARQMVAQQIGQPIETLFSQFDDAAVAAASIAQVHRATLCDGREVAVKLLRPDIEKHMLADTALFYSLGANSAMAGTRPSAPASGDSGEAVQAAFRDGA